MDPKKINLILLIALIFILLLGVKTLLPNSGASKPNLLDFKSACTFTPVSTLILFWIAAIIYVIRVRLMSNGGLKGMYGFLIVLSVLFVGGIIFYSFKYVKTKADVSTIKTGNVSQSESSPENPQQPGCSAETRNNK